MDMAQIRHVLLRAGVAFTTLEETRLLRGQPAYHVTVPHETAFSSWRVLREWVGQTGCWPVITRPPDQNPLEALYEPSGHKPDDLLAAAAAIDLHAWLARENDLAADTDEDAASLLGHWPEWLDLEYLDDYDPEDYTELDEMFVMSGEPPLSIVLLPVGEGWQVFTLIAPTGGDSQRYNSTALHLVIHKHWSHRYGAELVALTRDEMELFIARPPDDPTTAIQVAWEHFAYCEEAVSIYSEDRFATNHNL
jgi:hypothetical protein